jgi:hypothetical protein
MTTPPTKKPAPKAEEALEPAPKITKKALVQNLLEAVRGHLSMMKKNNIVITSERIDGERHYFIKKQAD